MIGRRRPNKHRGVSCDIEELVPARAGNRLPPPNGESNLLPHETGLILTLESHSGGVLWKFMRKRASEEAKQSHRQAWRTPWPRVLVAIKPVKRNSPLGTPSQGTGICGAGGSRAVISQTPVRLRQWPSYARAGSV